MAAWFGSFATDFAVLLLAILAIAYLFFKHRYSYWTRKGVFNIPATIPLGNMEKVALKKSSFPEEFRKLYEKYRKSGARYGGFFVIAQKIFFPLDPELIKQIMTKDFPYFMDRGIYYNEKNDPLNAHLVSLDGQKWKNLRYKLTPTFSSGKMKMMFPTLIKCGVPLKVVMDEKARTGEPIDIKDVLARFTTDIIGSCAFGIDCNSLQEPDNEFRKYGRKIFNVSKRAATKRTLFLSLPRFIQDRIKYSRVSKEIQSFFMGIVKSTIDYRESSGLKRNDFMDLLLQLKNQGTLSDEKNGHVESQHHQGEPPKLTFNEIAAQCYIFFLAGFETSSTTMTFCLYELARNPDIQEKLRAEVLETLKNDAGNLTYESVMHMRYLEKVVSETLRKYPPVPMLPRRCNKPYKVPDSDLVLEEGQRLFIPVIGMHWDPEYYPNPAKFDPERFTAEEIAKRHPFTYLPFGEGPRNCIGMRFGLMQTKVGLSLLLSNYRLTVSSKTLDPLVMNPTSFIQAAKGEIWLQAEKL